MANLARRKNTTLPTDIKSGTKRTTRGSAYTPRANSILAGQLRTIARHGTPQQLAKAREVAKGGGQPWWAKGLTGAAFVGGLPSRAVSAMVGQALFSRQPEFDRDFVGKILDPWYGVADEIETVTNLGNNTWAKTTIGLSGDVLLDPLTYMTFGASAGLKAAGRGRGLANLALDAAEVAKREAGVIRAAGAGGTDDLPTLFTGALKQAEADATKYATMATTAGRGGTRLSQLQLDEFAELAGRAPGEFSYGVHFGVPFRGAEPVFSARGAVGGRIGRGLERVGEGVTRRTADTWLGKNLGGNLAKAKQWVQSDDPAKVRKGARIITSEQRGHQAETYALRSMKAARAGVERRAKKLGMGIGSEGATELDAALRERPLALRGADGNVVLDEKGKRVFDPQGGGQAWQEMVARSPDHEALLNDLANMIADRRTFAHDTAAHGQHKVEFLADAEESGRPYVQRIPNKEFAKELGVTTRSTNVPGRPAFMEKAGIAPEGRAGEAFKRKFDVDIVTPGEVTDTFPEGAPSIEDQIEIAARAKYGDQYVEWYERDFWRSNEVYERGLAKAIGKYKRANYLTAKGIARDLPTGNLGDALVRAGPSAWRDDLFMGWEDGQMMSAAGKPVKNPVYEALQIELDRNNAILDPLNTQFDIDLDDYAEANDLLMAAESELASLPRKPLRVESPLARQAIKDHGEDKAMAALADRATELRAEAARLRAGGERGTLERYAAAARQAGAPRSKVDALRRQILELAEGERGTLERYAAAGGRGRARQVPGGREKVAQLRTEAKARAAEETADLAAQADELDDLARQHDEAVTELAWAEQTRPVGAPGATRAGDVAKARHAAYKEAKALFRARDQAQDATLQQVLHLDAKRAMLEGALANPRTARWDVILKDHERVAKAMHRALHQGWEGFGFARQAPPDVIEVLKDINASYDPITGQGLSGFMEAYDNLLHWTKGWMTASPGFLARNVFGGMFNNWLAGVDIFTSGKRWFSILNQASPFRGGIDTSAMKAGDRALYEMADRMGLIGAGQYTAELGGLGHASLNPMAGVRGGDKSFVLPYAIKRANEQFFEPYLRGTLFYDRVVKAIERGRFKALGVADMDALGRMTDDQVEAFVSGVIDSPVADEITADVFKYHFDYDDLSAMERSGIRRIIPFYTWTRKNVPLQVEAMLTQPGKSINRYMALKKNMEESSEQEGIVPSWMDTQGFMRLPFTTGGNRAYATMDLPFKDPFQVADVSGELVGMVNPLIKLPLEAQFNKRFFNDVPLTDEFKPMPGAWAKIPGLIPALQLADKMAFVPISAPQQDRNGAWHMREQDAYVVEQLLPFMGQLRRLVTGWDPSIEGEPSKAQSRLVSTLLSYTSGVAFRTNTPSDMESEIYRRIEGLDQPVADLRALGAVPERPRRQRRSMSLESVLASVEPRGTPYEDTEAAE